MTNKEARDWVDIARMGYICDPNECGLEKGGDPCKAFHCDEIHDALVMAIEALEKQIPKKPKATYDWYILIQWECPECLGVIDSPTFMDYSVEKYPFCPYCGQKLDWRVVE
ncbi:MAG: hypothetical protein Q4A15_03935 [Prevotellaceae bacterium]|nr:hypothetical protein [Prevotellaceae bacterium]